MTTIEKLAVKYANATGSSPEHSFWSWLNAMGVNPDETELQALLEDDEFWGAMRVLHH